VRTAEDGGVAPQQSPGRPAAHLAAPPAPHAAPASRTVTPRATGGGGYETRPVAPAVALRQQPHGSDGERGGGGAGGGNERDREREREAERERDRQAIREIERAKREREREFVESQARHRAR